LFESFTERGGFLRRAFALLIDLIVIGAVVQLIGFAAYPLSNGYVQTSGVIRHSQCNVDSVAPPGVTVNLDFVPTYFAHCRHGLFGFEMARTFTAGRVDRVEWPLIGAVNRAQHFTVRVDHDGRIIRGVTLDLLVLPLLLLYRIVFERSFGAALGKWMLQQRVVDQTTRALAPIDHVVLRNFLFALPFLPFAVLAIWPTSGGVLSTSVWIILGIAIGCIVIAFIVATVQIVRRRDTFYDRRAGTTVIQRPFYPDAVPAKQEQK
jgi:uncharacterized membrane protein (DUF485 family)